MPPIEENVERQQDEETPLLLLRPGRSNRESSASINHGSLVMADDEQESSSSVETSISSPPPLFLADRRRSSSSRRRIVMVTLLALTFLAASLLAFDGVGHTSISWKRNNEKKKKHHHKGKSTADDDSASSWWADSALMQVARRAKRSFSKIVIIVVNDQGGKDKDDNGDDDDDDQDLQDANQEEHDENTSSKGRNGSRSGNSYHQDNTSDYLDDDNVKSQVESKENGDNESKDNESENDSEDAVCEPKDWKCWRDKYQELSTKKDDDAATENASSEEESTKVTEPPPDVPMLGSSINVEKTRSVEQKSKVKSKKATKNDNSSNTDDATKEDEIKELKKMDKKKSEGVAYCEDGKYSKRTLKLAYEMPFHGLFRDTKGQRKFEASSVTVVDDVAYAICDSSWSISMFDPYLHPFGEHNHQIGDPYREKEDSGYEALFYDGGIFYVVRESVQDSDQTYHAIIEELILDTEVNHDTYEFGKACPTEFEFEGNSKGFEGAIPIHDLNGDLVVLGLCEGNHCSESKELKGDKGNGRLVAMKQETLPDGTCQWSTIRSIKIPVTAYFQDYSAIDMDANGRVLISSQEESQVWVGQMDGVQLDGTWDVLGMEFQSEEYTLYDFPKNDNCETMYCNVEGVHWVDDYTIIAVSDKMKSKGKQSSSCFEKDQSAHLFVFP